MDPKAIEKCHSRLRNAQRALRDFEKCEDFLLFSDLWVQFLQAWKGVYTILEQGAKKSARSRQWYGDNVKKERRQDPLLRYLFAARDDEEHGLDRPLVEGAEALFPVKEGLSYRDGTKDDGTPILIEEASGTIIEPEKLNLSGVVMKAVTERGGNVVFPPLKHLGKSLDELTPLYAATLGLAYMENLVSVAEEL